MRNKQTLKVGIALVLLVSSFNLTACGGRIKPATQVAPATQAPSDNFYNDPGLNDPAYNNPNGSLGNVPAIPTGTPNTQLGTFMADQATLNQWQARGIAVSSGTIYLSVADTSGLSKKGAIVKMSSTDGKSWKDLTSKLLGLSHPISATVEGLSVSGGTIVAADSSGKIYNVDASNGKVNVIKGTGGKDVASSAGSLFIANGSVEKTDTSASSRLPVNGMSATGGVGSDNLGNVYAVSGNTIKKADNTGMVQDVVTSDLTAPLDVAVDSRNGDIYVLEQAMIKRFTSNGQLVVPFSNGATKPVGIAIDEAGAVYVADAGTSNKDSKVIKFAASVDNMNNMNMGGGGYNSNNYGYGNSYGSSTANNGAYNSYDSYSNTRTSRNGR